VILGIYWHALRLWLKGVPLFTHPDKPVRQPDSSPHPANAANPLDTLETPT
jgi:DUF1365 family protein